MIKLQPTPCGAGKPLSPTPLFRPTPGRRATEGLAWRSGLLLGLIASLAFGLCLGWTSPAAAQAYQQDAASTARVDLSATPEFVHEVKRQHERLEMTVNTSRRLKLDQKIPEAQVNNPDILDLTALAPNVIQVSAKNPGVTQVNLWGEDNKIYTVDVIVYRDVAELDMILKMQFPDANLKVVPVGSGVMIAGYVDQPDHVSLITRIAEEYYPKVIPAMTVSGVQQILLHVRVMEVSRTKLRALGFDFAKVTGNNLVVSGVSGLIASVADGAVSTSGDETFAFNVVDGSSAFFGVLEALRQDQLMKILAEPTLVTVSGRPAFFQVGGEFPILVPQSLGTVSIEYKKFGTQVDFVPIVLGNGRIRLEVRPRVSEIDNTRSVTINSTTVPGLRTREVDTGVEMTAGQTLAIAGLVQTRVEAENKGLPWVSEVPYLGMLFRRVQHQDNEIELLVLVTPELVEAMDPSEVPPCGPGSTTTNPSDWDLFTKGHLEVPNCCPDYGCGTCDAGASPQIVGGLGDMGGLDMPMESVPQGYQPGEMQPGRMQPGGMPTQPVEPLPTPDSRPAQPEDGPELGRRRASQRVASRDLPLRYQKPAYQPVSLSSQRVAPTRPTTARNPYDRQAPTRKPPVKAKKTSDSTPGFIGPIGYDVLN